MTDFATAMRAMIDQKFVASQRYKDQQMRANTEGAHPDILEFGKRLVTRMRKQGVPLFILNCVRGEAAQNEYFKTGMSRAKYGQSAHNYGMAVDIIHGRKGYELDRKSWDLLGHIGKEISVQAGIPITWGGDFRSLYDPAHWELKEWRTLSQGMQPFP